MIERITSLDLYSHVRVEISTREGRGRARREKDVTGSSGSQSATAGRGAPRQLGVEHNVVAFEQSALAGERDGAAATAEEVAPALEASVLPADPQLAQVARLYRRAGGSGKLETGVVGSRFAAYA